MAARSIAPNNGLTHQLNRCNAVVDTADEAAVHGHGVAAVLGAGEAACLVSIDDEVQGITIGRLIAGLNTNIDPAVAHDADADALTNRQVAVHVILGGAVVGGHTLELVGGGSGIGQSDIGAGLGPLHHTHAELHHAVLLFVQEGINGIGRQIDNAAGGANRGCVTVTGLSTHLTCPPSSADGRSCAAGP